MTQPVEKDSQPISIQFEKLKLHFAYLVIFLVFTMIMLATGQFTPKEKFTEYLSNAATLISVVLGLVAIIYSFISNDSLSKSLGSISNITDQIGKTREQMATYVSQTSEITHNANEGAALMKGASVEMKRSFADLSSLLSAIHEQSNGFKEIFNERFDSLDEKLEQKESNQSKTSQSTTNDILPESIVKKFIDECGLATNLLCYAITLAIKIRKEFPLIDFCKATHWELLDELRGVIRTMDAVGIIRVNEDDDDNYFFEYVHPTLLEKAGPTFKNYVSAKFSNNQSKLEFWNQHIKSTENFFK